MQVLGEMVGFAFRECQSRKGQSLGEETRICEAHLGQKEMGLLFLQLSCCCYLTEVEVPQFWSPAQKTCKRDLLLTHRGDPGARGVAPRGQAQYDCSPFREVVRKTQKPRPPDSQNFLLHVAIRVQSPVSSFPVSKTAINIKPFKRNWGNYLCPHFADLGKRNPHPPEIDIMERNFPRETRTRYRVCISMRRFSHCYKTADSGYCFIKVTTGIPHKIS